jgi:hypothetical protein
LEGVDWIRLAEEGDHWHAVVDTIMNHGFHIRQEFLDRLNVLLTSQEELCSMCLASFFTYKIAIGGVELPAAFVQARRQD